jgi:hypothetical protein
MIHFTSRIYLTFFAFALAFVNVLVPVHWNTIALLIAFFVLLLLTV